MFKIYNTANFIEIRKDENDVILDPIIIDIDSSSNFFTDKYINLSWDPVNKQMVFNIFNEHTVRGGYTIFNSRKNATKIFQYLALKQNNYYFAERGIVNQAYSFNVNWNRCNLWISSVFDETFPYYDITVRNNSNKIYIFITRIKAN